MVTELVDCVLGKQQTAKSKAQTICSFNYSTLWTVGPLKMTARVADRACQASYMTQGIQ